MCIYKFNVLIQPPPTHQIMQISLTYSSKNIQCICKTLTVFTSLKKRENFRVRWTFITTITATGYIIMIRWGYLIRHCPISMRPLINQGGIGKYLQIRIKNSPGKISNKLTITSHDILTASIFTSRLYRELTGTREECRDGESFDVYHGRLSGASVL